MMGDGNVNFQPQGDGLSPFEVRSQPDAKIPRTEDADAEEKSAGDAMVATGADSDTEEASGQSPYTPLVVISLADDVRSAMAVQVPKKTSSGAGTSWILNNSNGVPVSIFKPSTQEASVQAKRNKKFFDAKGIPQGEGFVRERVGFIIATELNRQFAKVGDCKFNVPRTTIEIFNHESFGEGGQIGSNQRYIEGSSPLKQINDANEAAKIPVAEVHRLAIYDMLTLNTDRHLGNVLTIKQVVAEGDYYYKLHLIDQGGILPDVIEDTEGIAMFSWAMLPQVDQDFSEEMKAAILNMNDHELTTSILEDLITQKKEFEDKIPSWEHSDDEKNVQENPILLLRANLALLKEGIRQELTPHQISSMIQREKTFGGGEYLRLFNDSISAEAAYRPIILKKRLEQILEDPTILEGKVRDAKKRWEKKVNSGLTV